MSRQTKSLCDGKIRKILLEESSDSAETEDSDVDDPRAAESPEGLDASTDDDDVEPSELAGTDTSDDDLSSGPCWNEITRKFKSRFSVPSERKPIVLANMSESPDELEVFRAVFPPSLFIRIAECTNKRLEILGKRTKRRFAQSDSGEIMILLGCSLIMGYNKLPKVKDYWSSAPSLGNATLKQAISRDRFALLSSKLYFNEPERPQGASKTYYIDELIECVKTLFPAARSESTFQSIDESMTKFKGRSSFKQYMPLKSVERGIKIWERCDSRTGYVYDLNVYAGKEPESRGSLLGERVVRKLAESIRTSHVMLAFDRFFTSVNLMDTLPFPSVGTVHQSRRNIPLFREKLSARGNMGFMVTKTGVLCSRWMDSREVLVLSNCHSNTVVKVSKRLKNGELEEFACPEAISCYNMIMGGVDLSDQKTAFYNPDRKSSKWWRRVFYKVLMIAVVNSWILFQEATRRGTPLITFLIRLAEGLIEAGKLKASVKRRPFHSKPSRRFLTKMNVGEHMPHEGQTRRRCVRCSVSQVEKRTKIICKACDVALCIGCFARFHE